MAQWRIDARTESTVANQIGRLTYTSGAASSLMTTGGGPTYDVGIPQQQAVPGVFISSHRSLTGYQQLQHLPAQFSASAAILDQFIAELRNRYSGGHSNRSPLYQMKEALVAAAIFGEGSGAVERNDEAAEIWEGFQRVLRALLPASMRFIRLRVRAPDALLETQDGEFLIDAVSGGVSAIVELAWQIFLRSRQYNAFTVCIDEPENHLHPSLQRSLIPSLLDAFPRLSFIVATHSPFIVTAVRDSSVYVLDYENGAVVSRLLDTVSKAATSDEILRRVLGLETTAPLWVERTLSQYLDRFPEYYSEGALRRLMDELRSMGLQEHFPAAIDALDARRSYETPE